MAKLPKSLIKKYGISKKAWSVFRGQSNSNKRRTKQMAKKRKSGRRFSSGGMKPVSILLGSGIYGAMRAKISNALMPITSKVPLGNISDESVLFLLGYFANRNLRDKTLKSVAQGAMFVEAARIGEAVVEGSAFGNSSSNGAGSTFPTLG